MKLSDSEARYLFRLCNFSGFLFDADEPLSVNMDNTTTGQKMWIFTYYVKKTLLVSFLQKNTLKVPASS